MPGLTICTAKITTFAKISSQFMYGVLRSGLSVRMGMIMVQQQILNGGVGIGKWGRVGCEAHRLSGRRGLAARLPKDAARPRRLNVRYLHCRVPTGAAGRPLR